ncbi:MAG TPA: hypothetical protein VFS00_00375, partial [Polyangiaceae bacterium]|nr:hypothetical protein [Polyangiaceae bacterium]
MTSRLARLAPVAAALSALVSLAGPAFAQSAPDALLSSNLRSLAGEFGDAEGHLSFTNAAGQHELLAHGYERYAAYTAGQTVNVGESLAFCVEDQVGRLSSCDKLAAPAPGGPTGYHCETDCTGASCDGWCECKGFLDCVNMAFSACTAGLDCS